MRNKKENGFTLHYKNSAGFTLLEILVAIMILSMVVVIIGSGFNLGIKAWEKGEAETNETQRLRIISGLMSQQLKSFYPYRMEIDGKNVIVFEGKSDSLLFVTILANEGGYKWVNYSFKDGKFLFKEGRLPDKKFQEKIEEDSGEEEIIDRDISEFKFEYFASDKEGWKDSWELGEKIPQAVRIKVGYFHPFLLTIPMGLKDSDESET